MIRLLLVGALLSPACIDAYEPDVGEPLAVTCFDEDSDPDTPTSFSSDVLPSFEADGVDCTLCHTAGGANPIGLEVAGLDLGSYNSLRAGGKTSGSNIVIPGRPCESILLQKVGSAPPFGARMPLNGPPYLSRTSWLLLHDWIAEGAENN